MSSKEDVEASHASATCGSPLIARLQAIMASLRAVNSNGVAARAQQLPPLHTGHKSAARGKGSSRRELGRHAGNAPRALPRRSGSSDERHPKLSAPVYTVRLDAATCLPGESLLNVSLQQVLDCLLILCSGPQSRRRWHAGYLLCTAYVYVLDGSRSRSAMQVSDRATWSMILLLPQSSQHAGQHALVCSPFRRTCAAHMEAAFRILHTLYGTIRFC